MHEQLNTPCMDESLRLITHPVGTFWKPIFSFRRATIKLKVLRFVAQIESCKIWTKRSKSNLQYYVTEEEEEEEDNNDDDDCFVSYLPRNNIINGSRGGLHHHVSGRNATTTSGQSFGSPDAACNGRNESVALNN